MKWPRSKVSLLCASLSTINLFLTTGTWSSEEHQLLWGVTCCRAAHSATSCSCLFNRLLFNLQHLSSSTTFLLFLCAICCFKWFPSQISSVSCYLLFPFSDQMVRLSANISLPFLVATRKGYMELGSKYSGWDLNWCQVKQFRFLLFFYEWSIKTDAVCCFAASCFCTLAQSFGLFRVLLCQCLGSLLLAECCCINGLLHWVLWLAWSGWRTLTSRGSSDKGASWGFLGFLIKWQMFEPPCCYHCDLNLDTQKKVICLLRSM